MLRILELMILLRPYTICHKFWLFTGFARVRHARTPTGGQGHALIFTVFFCISLHTPTMR